MTLKCKSIMTQFIKYNTNSICGTMKSVIPLGTKSIDTVSAALDNDMVFIDAINLFLDAEDEVDESHLT